MNNSITLGYILCIIFTCTTFLCIILSSKYSSNSCPSTSKSEAYFLNTQSKGFFFLVSRREKNMAKHLHVNSNFYYLLQWPSNPASFAFCLHFFSILQEEWTFQKEYPADHFLISLPLKNSELLTSMCIPLICQAAPS